MEKFPMPSKLATKIKTKPTFWRFDSHLKLYSSSRETLMCPSIFSNLKHLSACFEFSTPNSVHCLFPKKTKNKQTRQRTCSGFSSLHPCSGYRPHLRAHHQHQSQSWKSGSSLQSTEAGKDSIYLPLSTYVLGLGKQLSNNAYYSVLRFAVMRRIHTKFGKMRSARSCLPANNDNGWSSDRWHVECLMLSHSTCASGGRELLKRHGIKKTNTWKANWIRFISL